MPSGGASHDIDGRLLVLGVCNLCNDWQLDLWGASRDVQVPIERGRQRLRHRLVYLQNRTDGDAVLVFLDEGPVDLDGHVLGDQLRVDRDVGDHPLAHDPSAAGQKDEQRRRQQSFSI